jgi:hypothetical protein
VLIFRFLAVIRSRCSLEGNQIGDAGAKDLAEAIKVNCTMTALE